MVSACREKAALVAASGTRNLAGFPALPVILVMAAFLAVGCSPGGPSPAVDPPASHGGQSLSRETTLWGCPAGYFSGIGISGDYDRALNQAVSRIAEQIESSVQSENLLQKTQRVHEGEESISSSYSQRTRVVSQLRNRQDVHVAKRIVREDSAAVLACMSLIDAAKPFRADLKEHTGKFRTAATALRTEQHPKARVQNFEAFRKAYNELVKARVVLQSLGAEGPDNTEMERMDAEYAELKGEYDRFRSGWRFYFDPHIESDAENALWAELQKRFALSSVDSCSGGLRLFIETFEPSCKEGGFGVSCTQAATLTGESCEGTRYFSMEAVLKGVGKDGEEDALKRIPLNAPKSDGVKAWIGELEEWEVK